MRGLKLLMVLTWLLPTLLHADPAWDPLLHPGAAAGPLDSEVRYFSSTAPNGGNNDLGQYPLGTDPNGWKILADVDGPGVLDELWLTKENLPATARIRIRLKNQPTPAVDTTVAALFSGEMAPFISPLADTASGGYFSYVPIPFDSGITVTYNNVTSIYYHVVCRSFPPGTAVTPFTVPQDAGYLANLDTLNTILANPGQPLNPADSRSDFTATLAAGQTATALDEAFTGITRRLLLRFTNRTKAVMDSVLVRIYVDGNPLPNIEGPASMVFGMPEGWRSYQSLNTGSSGDTLYFNAPIPVGHRLRVELQNGTGQAQPLTVAVEVTYGDPGEYELLAVYRDANPTVLWQNTRIAEFEGAGNFIGMVLDISGTDNHVLEGDEYIYRDGVQAWKGSGTEDYFKGAYYWQTGITRFALHGCIGLIGGGATTAAYRWHLAPVSFDEQLRFEFEVGRFNNLSSRYRSMSFAYVRQPRWRALDISGDGATHANEKLRIVGCGIDPAAGITEVTLGGVTLQLAGGSSLTVTDSILDAWLIAPDTLPPGTYPLVAITAGGPDTIAAPWLHLGPPTLTYLVARTETAGESFAGDTLNIELHGLQSGEGAAMAIDGLPVPWLLGPTPLADSSGKLTGQIRIQPGLHPGDYPLTATPEYSSPALCDTPIRCRSWFRVEPETLERLAWSGTRIKEEWCLDWNPSTAIPWGRNAAQSLTGTSASSYATYRFYAPSAGTFTPAFFFARANSAAIVSVEINGTPSLTSADLYRTGGQWIRSDTLWGTPAVLNSGLNTVTFRTIGKNPSSLDWIAAFDQICFVLTPAQPAPLPITQLVVQVSAGNLILTWPAVMQDVLGNPIAVSTYGIYRTLPTEPQWLLHGQVAGDVTQWTSPIDQAEPAATFTVTALRGGAAPLNSLPRDDTPNYAPTKPAGAER